ncbi:putative polygalacturonase, partial [Ananas comosus]
MKEAIAEAHQHGLQRCLRHVQSPPWPLRALVLGISSTMKKFAATQVLFVKREANMVADWLATRANLPQSSFSNIYLILVVAGFHKLVLMKQEITATIGLLFLLGVQLTLGKRVYNVLDFHARGDAKTDDTQAFLNAWEAACEDSAYSTLLVPSKKTFLLSRITFAGPCLNGIHFQLSGNIVAPIREWTSEQTNLVTFININRLTVDGGGRIDGRGSVWWDCFAENLLAFLGCDNLSVMGISLKDSPSKHMTFYQCRGVRVEGVTVTAPGESPNTDGILVAFSQHVQITSSTIGCGDDCIAVASGSSDVNISKITCGPGHGISIGSLGGGGEKAAVERIHGGSGYAKAISFEHINISSVHIPIIIDQYYCPRENCPNKTGAVAISMVQFVDIHGTSSGEEAIKIACSKTVACKKLVFSNVALDWEGKTAPAKATGFNAHGRTIGRVVPPVPLLK